GSRLAAPRRRPAPRRQPPRTGELPAWQGLGNAGPGCASRNLHGIGWTGREDGRLRLSQWNSQCQAATGSYSRWSLAHDEFLRSARKHDRGDARRTGTDDDGKVVFSEPIGEPPNISVDHQLRDLR